ncbi:MAG: histidinol-phosphate transaminase [Eubacteriales bacterium]|nr:histidinol-phosphate transaminase [Eubacteriales bacterium]NLN94357.1 histidinol-phosphate aminotransferase family protein [Candidatus Hydrogenedens sp.]NLV70316.1 histidinol-phosphate aminotransferase family protein [Clostridiales bacterium]HPF19573.1 histidinol-phosphate transaminase [Bacillota bacterium]
MRHYNKFQWSLKPYRLASHKIWSVEPRERDEYLKLDWNEASIQPSPRVSERIHKLLEHENFYNLYPSMINPELNGLLSRYVGLPEDHILYFSGSDVVHECIVRSYIAPGDSVLILGPSYDNFRLTAESAGCQLFFSEVSRTFEFIPEKFEADIDAVHPSFLYICSPNNPTGHLQPAEYVEHLLNKYPESMFLVDEAYYEFAGKSVCGLTQNYENIVVTRTMSKAFALANFRFGYMITNPVNIEHMNKIRNPKNINSFTQAAACGVLEDLEYMQSYVEECNKAKDWFFGELKKRSSRLTVYYGYANALLVEFPTIEEMEGMFQHLSQNKIFVRPLKQSALLEKCLRISIGTSGQMKRVLASMDEYFASER